MKKIISLLAATMMMFSFSAISYAAGGDLTTTISNEEVEVNTDTATVTYTFDFPENISLLALQPQVTFPKDALTLKTFTLSGEDVTWATSDSNLNEDYGAYLSFDDLNYAGTKPASQYVMTLTFTINDPTKVATYEVGLLDLVGTDSDYNGLMDIYNIVMPEAGSISVKGTTPDPEPITTTSYFGANVKTSEKPSLAQILVYTFTTNDEGAARKTATREIDLGSASFETPTTINTAARVSGIPDGVTVGCSVAWK